ncbi:MAG: tetratricopeptide repeat protein [Deltaproteobacteria bacterium]|nr:tetratricopeptide repeat protein [Deltaproteobacteria bacterium]
MVSCRACKKPLPDPFDAALGVCESCRSQEQSLLPQSPTGPAKQQIVVGGAAARPVSADPFNEAASSLPRPDGGELELDRSDRSQGSAHSPSASTVATSVAAARVQRSGSAERAQPLRYRRGEGGIGKWLAVLALLALAGGGGYLWHAKPTWLFKKPVKKVHPAIEARLMDWKMGAVGLTGNASEHFARGRKAFLVDKPTSYLEAEEEFKAAVILDPHDLRSVAAYVEAFAVGRGERAPETGLAEARELLGAVLGAQPAMGLAHRARAALYLATDETENARREAEKAIELATPEEQAEALLTLGCTYLKKSAPIALEKIDAALKRDKAIKRAWYYRGLANENAGRFAAALADLGERLTLDPDQREALAAQARVFAKLGDFPSARKTLATFASKHPTVGQPRVMLVQLAYQVDRDVREAEKALRELKQDEPRFDDQDRLELHTLWAAVSRERGDLKAAVAQADEALAINKKWAPAHFQKMLAHLAAGEHDKARAELKECEARFDDLVRVKDVQGRIEAAAGNLEGAVLAYREAAERSPGRVGPRLALAAVLARKGDLDQAWSVMRKALDADPGAVARERRQVGDFFEPPTESVRHTAKVFEAIHEEYNTLPQIYSAVAQYHLGELDRPQAALDRALVADPNALAPLLYRAQIELERKRFDAAMGFALKAIKAERQNAVAYYLKGRAEEGLKKLDQARISYLAALERDPGLAPANARMGVLSADDDPEGAKRSFLQALQVDANTMDSITGLFKVGW